MYLHIDLYLIYESISEFESSKEMIKVTDGGRYEDRDRGRDEDRDRGRVRERERWAGGYSY